MLILAPLGMQIYGTSLLSTMAQTPPTTFQYKKIHYFVYIIMNSNTIHFR